MAEPNKCPVCGETVIINEDWPMGRITACPKYVSTSRDGKHYRRVERFDKRPSDELLDEQEKEEHRHAA